MITWNWPACVNVPLALGSSSIAATSALSGSTSTKRIRVMQWVTAEMFPLPPTRSRSLSASAVYFAICLLLLVVLLGTTYLNKLGDSVAWLI